MSVSLHIQPLDAEKHDRFGFDCGEPALNDYLAKRARKEMTSGVAACFVATASENTREVLGYYTLSAVSIVRTQLPPEILGKLPRYREMPATLLGRLAVARAFQGMGLGGRLLVSAMNRAQNASEEVASLAVVADPKDEAAAGFYRKFGFQTLASGRLFLPIKDIAAFLNAP